MTPKLLKLIKAYVNLRIEMLEHDNITSKVTILNKILYNLLDGVDESEYENLSSWLNYLKIRSINNIYFNYLVDSYFSKKENNIEYILVDGHNSYIGEDNKFHYIYKTYFLSNKESLLYLLDMASTLKLSLDYSFFHNYVHVYDKDLTEINKYNLLLYSDIRLDNYRRNELLNPIYRFHVEKTYDSVGYFVVYDLAYREIKELNDYMKNIGLYDYLESGFVIRDDFVKIKRSDFMSKKNELETFIKKI